MKRVVALAGLATLTASCHLAEQRENPALGARNACTDDSICGAEGTCIGGRCVSTSYVAPDALVFEVTPSAVAETAPGFVPGVSYYLYSDKAKCPEGSCLPPVGFQVTSFETLKLPPIVSASVSVKLAPDALAAYADCSLPTAGGDTLRAAILVLPDEQIGLPKPALLGSAPDSAGGITIAAQPGSYSLYVRLLAPTQTDKPACRIPPLLLRGYTSDPQTKDYSIKLPSVEHVQGTITGPPGVPFPFEGWQIDVVDSATGLVLSTGGTVATPQGSVGAFGPVDFFSPQDATSSTPGSYVLRVSPPEGSAELPSFAWTSDVLTVGAGEQVALDLSAYQPGVVAVSDARLEDATTNQGVAGRVFIRSLAKHGVTGAPPGRPAGFMVPVPIAIHPEDLGRFDVTLPPGQFQVVGVADCPDQGNVCVSPDGASELGLVNNLWVVAPTPSVQGGRVLSVGPRPRVSLSLTALAGSPAPNVAVEAVSAPTFTGAFDRVFGFDPILPRGGAMVTDASGHGSIVTDASFGEDGVTDTGTTFDVIAKFPARFGFPWSVRRGVEVIADVSLSLPVVLPVVVRGRIALPNAEFDVPISGGTLRAFALLPAAGGVPARYVQVAETTVDELGEYEILLPARVLDL